MLEDKLLEGRVAIVTGSGQGIGREIALCMAEHGAKVITNNRKPGSSLNAFEKTDLAFDDAEQKALLALSGDAESTAREILAMGGEAIPVYGDVSDYDNAGKLVQTALEAWGRVDIIVNNASSNWTGNIRDMDKELWDRQIHSKLMSSFYLMHHALPAMEEQRYGRILNSASDAWVGISSYAAYGAANAALVALTKASAKDLAGNAITVNAYTPLAMTRSWYNALATYKRRGIPASVIEANSPKAMRTTPEGMVPFLAWLASEEAGDISGKLFQLAADGEIGLWSESEIVKSIREESGVWTIEELRKRVKEELL